MRFRAIETTIVSIFVFLAIVSFIPMRFELRLLGQNILNARLWMYLSMLIVFFSEKKIIFRKPIMASVLLLLVFITLERIGHYDLQGVYSRRYYMLENQILPITVSVLLGVHFMQVTRLSQLKVILGTGLFAYLLVSMISIFIILRYPGAVRGTGLYFENTYYERMGLGDYSFLSSIPMLLSSFVFAFRSKLWLGRLHGAGWIWLSSIMMICSFLSALFAPFIISVSSFFVSIMGERRASANNAVFGIILLLFIIFPKPVIGQIFITLSEYVSNEEIKSKLNDTGRVFTEGIEINKDNEQSDNEIEGRASRIPLTLEAFRRSPFVGGGRIVNSHVYWLNYAAQFGLLGLIPLILVVWQYFKTIIKGKRSEYRFYQLITLLTFLVLGLIKALLGFPIFMAALFIGPGLIYYSEHVLYKGSGV